MPVTNLTLFNQLLGTLSPRAAVLAYVNPEETPDHDGFTDGDGAGYINRWDTYWNIHYAYYGNDGNGHTFDEWWFSNYYDRANVGYQKYAMDGYNNETVLTAANSLAIMYRDWLITNNFQTAQNNQFLRGVALHHAASGVASSKSTVVSVAANNAATGYWPRLGHLYGAGGVGDMTFVSDQRIWARIGESIRLAHMLGDTSQNWASISATWINQILNGSAHFPDGSFRSADAQKWVSGTTQATYVFNPNIVYRRPFYTGVLLYEMMEQYRIWPDARIITAVVNACEDLWTGTPTEVGQAALWVPGPDVWNSRNSHAYLETPSQSGYPGTSSTEIKNLPVECAPDLNGLIVAAHAFCYKHTSLAVWKQRFDKMLDGMKQANLYISTAKQFNENYSSTPQMWPMILDSAVNLKKIRLKWK